jgi:acyl-coenzyme A thioesterase PaaI-like protein
MPAGTRVLSVEFRLHLLAPAEGELLVATGRVVRSGRTLTVCELEVAAEKGGERTVCAWGSQTVICLAGRSDRMPGE